MKKLFATMVVCLLGLSQLALAQGRIKAYAVDLETNGFAAIDLALPAQAPTNLASRYLGSAQHLAWWLDTWAASANTNLSGIASRLALLGSSSETNFAALHSAVDSIETNLAAAEVSIASQWDYLANPTNGVVPLIKDGLDRATTNFGRINQNTASTSNLFTIVAALLGVPANTNVVSGSTSTVAQAYASWLASFYQMNTAGTALPTNAPVARFPNILASLETNLLVAAAELVQDSQETVTNLVASNANFYAFSAWITNGGLHGATGRYFTVGSTGRVNDKENFDLRYDVAQEFGGAFNRTTGVFTARVEGWYVFNASANTIAPDETMLFAGITKSIADTNAAPTDDLGSFWMQSMPDSDHCRRMVGSVVHTLSSGDTVRLSLYCGDIPAMSNVYFNSRFSGYLLQRGEVAP